MRIVLLAAVLQWSLGLPAPSPAPAAAAPAVESSDAGPAAIPLPQLLRSAEDAHRTVRSMVGRLADRQLIEEVQQRLPALVAKVDPLAGQEALVSKREVADLRPALQRADQTLAVWDDGLESAVRAVYANKQELQQMDAVWALTEAHARQEAVPTALLERIAALRASIAATAAQAGGQLDQLLAAQDQVATVRLRIADALAGVARVESLEAEQLFEVESVPLWKLLSRPAQGEKLRQQIIQALRIHAIALTDFMWVQSGRVLLLLGCLVLLTTVLWRGRRRLEAEMAADPSVSTAVDVLLHPFAAACLLTLALAAASLERPPPRDC